MRLTLAAAAHVGFAGGRVWGVWGGGGTWRCIRVEINLACRTELRTKMLFSHDRAGMCYQSPAHGDRLSITASE